MRAEAPRAVVAPMHACRPPLLEYTCMVLRFAFVCRVCLFVGVFACRKSVSSFASLRELSELISAPIDESHEHDSEARRQCAAISKNRYIYNHHRAAACRCSNRSTIAVERSPVARPTVARAHRLAHLLEPHGRATPGPILSDGAPICRRRTTMGQRECSDGTPPLRRPALGRAGDGAGGRGHTTSFGESLAAQPAREKAADHASLARVSLPHLRRD